MSIHHLSAEAALRQWSQFDVLIDARSEAEHAIDHLPHAVNWPTLDEAQRIEVGTLYKQSSPFEARKRGAAYASRNIALHIEREVLNQPKTWKPLLYCWRGGQRSGALATVLGAIGFSVTLIQGGYKAWRAALVVALDALAPVLNYRVIAGPTGCGKTRILQELRALGAQVLDLEGLAHHRSSALGHWPGQHQPSQKAFESAVWLQLQSFDPHVPVYVECESQKVGNLRIPTLLMQHIRSSPCHVIHMPDAARAEVLQADYPHFLTDPAHFCDRLDALIPHLGHAQIQKWHTAIDTGHTMSVVEDLLQRHYDPLYRASMSRHFTQLNRSPIWEMTNASPENCAATAQAMLAFDGQAQPQ